MDCILQREWFTNGFVVLGLAALVSACSSDRLVSETGSEAQDSSTGTSQWETSGEALTPTTAPDPETTTTEIAPSDTDEPSCDPRRSAVEADFALVLEDDWAREDRLFNTDSHELDVHCTVDAVLVSSSNSITQMTCDDEGTPRGALLTLAPSPVWGAVAWSAGDELRVRSWATFDTDLGLGAFRELTVRRADDDALLVAGILNERLSQSEVAPFAPLAIEPLGRCPIHDGIAGEVPSMFDLRITNPAGVEETALRGQYGELPAGDGSGDVYRIAVAQAQGGLCCHFTEWYEVLIQRAARSP